jgi:hypothetical protein
MTDGQRNELAVGIGLVVLGLGALAVGIPLWPEAGAMPGPSAAPVCLLGPVRCWGCCSRSRLQRGTAQDLISARALSEDSRKARRTLSVAFTCAYQRSRFTRPRSLIQDAAPPRQWPGGEIIRCRRRLSARRPRSLPRNPGRERCRKHRAGGRRPASGRSPGSACGQPRGRQQGRDHP